MSGLIAVSYKDTSGVNQIFLVTPDGLQRTQLTHNTFDSIYPRWSPNGASLVYVRRNQDGSTSIRVANADGSNDRAIADSMSVNMTPDWRDDQAIAYTSGTSERTDMHIWTMSPDGTNKRQVTSGGARDLAPTYSPDGQSIAFCSDRSGGRWQVWKTNADGTSPMQLTQSSVDPATGFPVEQKVPAWSPDGRTIAYWSGIEMDYLSAGVRNGTAPPTATDILIFHSWYIWLMNSDGTNQRRLTPGDDPAWSADSTLVLHPTMPFFHFIQPEQPGVGSTGVDGTGRDMIFSTGSDGPSGYFWQRT
jgi:Tol biopolymer transport system component